MLLVISVISVISSQAITTPAMAVSHIMLEAYKKYILVSLILHGKVQQLPKYTSQIVGRFIKVRDSDDPCAALGWGFRSTSCITNPLYHVSRKTLTS